MNAEEEIFKVHKELGDSEIKYQSDVYPYLQKIGLPEVSALFSEFTKKCTEILIAYTYHKLKDPDYARNEQVRTVIFLLGAKNKFNDFPLKKFSRELYPFLEQLEIFKNKSSDDEILRVNNSVTKGEYQWIFINKLHDFNSSLQNKTKEIAQNSEPIDPYVTTQDSETIDPYVTTQDSETIDPDVTTQDSETTYPDIITTQESSTVTTPCKVVKNNKKNLLISGAVLSGVGFIASFIVFFLNKTEKLQANNTESIVITAFLVASFVSLFTLAALAMTTKPKTTLEGLTNDPIHSPTKNI